MLLFTCEAEAGVFSGRYGTYMRYNSIPYHTTPYLKAAC